MQKNVHSVKPMKQKWWRILGLSQSRMRIKEELNVRGLNCLHLSAKAGDIQIFENILAQVVNIAMGANDERNVLHIAAHQGNYAICEFILQKHKDLFSNKDRY